MHFHFRIFKRLNYKISLLVSKGQNPSIHPGPLLYLNKIIIAHCLYYMKGGKWYCNQCKSGTEQPEAIDKPDLKNLYVKALTYNGLMDLVRHDAVRENDGDAMMGHWRHDVVQFHNRHHPKYVALAHRLLAGLVCYIGRVHIHIHYIFLVIFV